jgi:hypothetical protein
MLFDGPNRRLSERTRILSNKPIIVGAACSPSWGWCAAGARATALGLRQMGLRQPHQLRLELAAARVALPARIRRSLDVGSLARSILIQAIARPPAITA